MRCSHPTAGRLQQRSGPTSSSSLVPRPIAPRCVSVRCSAAPAAAATLPDGGKRVLVIGGTGRVGSSTASALLKTFPNLKLTVASRSRGSYEDAVGRRPELKQAAFREVDIADPKSVQVGTGTRGDGW